MRRMLALTLATLLLAAPAQAATPTVVYSPDDEAPAITLSLAGSPGEVVAMTLSTVYPLTLSVYTPGAGAWDCQTTATRPGAYVPAVATAMRCTVTLPADGLAHARLMFDVDGRPGERHCLSSPAAALTVAGAQVAVPLPTGQVCSPSSSGGGGSRVRLPLVMG